MKIQIEKININYEDYGNKESPPLVYLHGWGQNIEMMKPIAEPFKNTNRIIIIDLPGFGQSDKPNDIWSVYDYVEVINKLLNKIKVKNPIMIGHSFGGKLTLLYASQYKCKKIILLASPFKVLIPKLSIKTKILKKLKKVPVLNKLENFAKKHIGSTDYKNADPLMRKIMTNHINLDITEDVKKIKCSSLIIWGENDLEVPMEHAYDLEKLIEDSGVVMLENSTHYAYLENLNTVIKIFRNFI